MNSKMRFWMLAPLALTILLTACAHDLPVSKALPKSSGSGYRQIDGETWVRLDKYEALERAYLDALGALEQVKSVK